MAGNSGEDDSSQMQKRPEDETISINGRNFYVRQIMSLPFTEAQCLIFHYYNDMSFRDIARLTDTSRSSVKRAIKLGTMRLFLLIGEGGAAK